MYKTFATEHDGMGRPVKDFVNETLRVPQPGSTLQCILRSVHMQCIKPKDLYTIVCKKSLQSRRALPTMAARRPHVFTYSVFSDPLSHLSLSVRTL